MDNLEIHRRRLDSFQQIFDRNHGRVFDVLISRLVYEEKLDIHSVEVEYEYKCDLYYDKDGGKVANPIDDSECDYLILCIFTIKNADHILPIDTLYCDEEQALLIINTPIISDN